MATHTDRAPATMPGQYWGYFVHAVVLGVPLSVAVAYATLLQTEPLRALARLPVAHEPREGPAAYAGVLVAPRDRMSPAGYDAALWSSWVTVSRRSGKYTHTTTCCAQRTVDRVSLALGSHSLDIAPETFAEATFGDDMNPWSLAPRLRTRPLVQNAGVLESEDIPREVLASCRDLPSSREGTWRYHEVSIAPGARVELAACATQGRLAPCRSGVASGHLASPHTLRDLARNVATRTMVTASLATLLLTSFVFVSLFGSLRALRASGRITLRTAAR